MAACMCKGKGTSLRTLTVYLATQPDLFSATYTPKPVLFRATHITETEKKTT